MRQHRRQLVLAQRASLTAIAVVAMVAGACAGPSPARIELPPDLPAAREAPLPVTTRTSEQPSDPGKWTPRRASTARTVPVPSPAALEAARLPPIPTGSVPILYYHRVQAVPDDWKRRTAAGRKAFIAYNTLPEAFEAQLDWLVEHGYSTILPRDLAAHWDRGKPLPRRPVIITFDDGTRDWVDVVLPMLRERGFVAEFYLTLDAIRVNAISWDDVRKLAEAGNGIGSHHVRHVQLAMLGWKRPAASRAVMWEEVSRSRAIIAREIGTAPDSIAYVGGGYDATLQRMVRRAGYTTARSIGRGIVQRRANRYALLVVRIGPRDDVRSIARGTLVDGLPTFAARMHGVSDRP